MERARGLRRSPAVVVAAAQGASRSQEQMTSFARDGLTGPPETRVVARQLWCGAGLSAAGIDGGILCDHFTLFVLMQLEAFGFCGQGRAGLRRGGHAALNTHGGRPGEAYLHGMNGIAEPVRRLRGTP